MAWSDRPTQMQLVTILDFLRWQIPYDKALKAIEFLENSATRRDVSDEMRRLRDLKQKHVLDGKNAFTGKIWEGFEYDDKAETLKKIRKMQGEQDD